MTVTTAALLVCLGGGVILAMWSDYMARHQDTPRRSHWRRLRRTWLRFKLWVKDLWAPPCVQCSNPATVCEECARHANPAFFPANEARYCPDCNVYFAPQSSVCPVCAGHSWCLANGKAEHAAAKKAKVVSMKGRRAR